MTSIVGIIQFTILENVSSVRRIYILLKYECSLNLFYVPILKQSKADQFGTLLLDD